MVQKNAKLSRRNFLLTIGAGGAATAAAVVVATKSGPGTPAAGDKKGSRGYHETAHTNNYYRTAKV